MVFQLYNGFGCLEGNIKLLCTGNRKGLLHISLTCFLYLSLCFPSPMLIQSDNLQSQIFIYSGMNDKNPSFVYQQQMRSGSTGQKISLIQAQFHLELRLSHILHQVFMIYEPSLHSLAEHSCIWLWCTVRTFMPLPATFCNKVASMVSGGKI